MTAVEIANLVKTFGDKRAVDSLTLTIPKGSFFGIAGPNGAGKSTMIRMVTGLLRPDEGEIRIDGIDVWPDPRKAKAIVGYVPDNPALFTRLTAREMLEYAGLLRSLDVAETARRSEELLRVLDLADDADKPIADFSLGMTKRIGLAVAMLHSPRVLILDEPFGALDPVNTRVMEEMLQRYRAGGGTVVFSSHVMDVVERLCDHVAIIASGRLLTQGSVTELSGGRSLQDAFIELVGGRDLQEEELAWLSSSSA